MPRFECNEPRRGSKKKYKDGRRQRTFISIFYFNPNPHIMKQYVFFLILVSILIPTLCTSQVKQEIENPKYDTVSIDIRSYNSFTFCSKNYKIPRDCDGNDQSNCCAFSAQVSQVSQSPVIGMVSCGNGTSLSWTYFDSEEIARDNWVSFPIQQEKQNKSYLKKKFKCYLANLEVNAYRISAESFTGYKRYEIIMYGTVNGQSVVVTLSSQKELNTNDDIPVEFRDIVRLN